VQEKQARLMLRNPDLRPEVEEARQSKLCRPTQRWNEIKEDFLKGPYPTDYAY